MNGAPADVQGVAIVGMSGRFPDARNLDEFWQNLRDGHESIKILSDEELEKRGADPAWKRNPSYVAAQSRLEGREEFDAGFFGYNAQEAEIIDPQQRLFLETAWAALEDAGYVPGSSDGLIGVYAGSSQNMYLWFNLLARPGFLQQHGGLRTVITNGADYLSSRTAYKLNLRGPSLSVQTACSTSLVALHLACQGLLNFECDLALAGGASLKVTPIEGYLYESGGLLSRDGHCRAFDAAATGTVFGDGVAAVVLKRLDDALRDGDTIRALVLGSAINNDGGHKAGFTAPAPAGQSAVVFQALEAAGVSADSIGYVEAHGTGTEMGDPIEVKALTSAFRASTDRRGFCALGSVKTNVGHLDAAAGIAGVIKAVLTLQHRQIPPALHFDKPNPDIDFDSSPFFVNRTLRDWPGPAPRRAGVSAFGIGGANAHVVLEEAPPARPIGPSRPAQLLLLSARGEKPLAAAVAQMADTCRTRPDLSLPDAAYTLSVGRHAFHHRVAVVAHSGAEAAARLERLEPSATVSGTVRTGNPPVAFLFPGQGAQAVDMGRGLYDHEPRFRARIDELCSALAREVGWDLRPLLFPAAAGVVAARGRLRQTEVTQPALFVIELALAEQWIHWGVTPHAMLGHSIGEYVAATLAGVFTWQDALGLVAARGRLMQACPPGGMLAVPLGEAALAPYLQASVEIAVVNTPTSTVVAGAPHALADLTTRLGAHGITPIPVATSHAFHSSLMISAIAPFTALVASLPRQAPTRRWVSNLTGTWITSEQATDPAYWAQHLRQPVRFADGVGTMLASGEVLFLEVGPGTTLGRFVGQHPSVRSVSPRASLPPAGPAAGDPNSDLDTLLLSLGALWTAGVTVDWTAFWSGQSRSRVPLPTYQFDRQRHWLDMVREGHSRTTGTEAPAVSAAQVRHLEDWFEVPGWKQSAAWSSSSPASHEWVVTADEAGLGAEVVAALREHGARVTTVEPGASFAELAPGRFILRFEETGDWRHVFATLRQRGAAPDRVICTAAVRSVSSHPDPSLERDAFFVPLALTQALSALESGSPGCVRLAIVVSNAFEVTGGDGLLPEGALAMGVARVAPREMSHVKARVVDVDFSGGSPDVARAAARAVIDETAIEELRTTAAYRRGRRWVRTIEAVKLPTGAHDDPFRRRGTYLITGGSGGLGLALAKALAETQCHLVLIARRGVPSDTVASLESRGGSVRVIAGDVAEPGVCQAAVVTARSAFGRIDGVIHAAGVPGGGLIALKTGTAAAGILRPKVAGTRALLDALASGTPDVIVLFSSIAALTGDVGQVDYAAANAYLDAVAQSESARGRRVLSLNWDAWRDTGMAVTTPQGGRRSEQRIERLGRGIPSSLGVEALCRAAASPLAQVSVSPVGIAVRRAEADATAFAVTSGATPQQPSHPRPSLATPYAAARNETERRLTAVWEDVIGVTGIGVDDTFFELGGDSLLATAVIARVRDAFGVDVTLRDVLEQSSIARLATLLTPDAGLGRSVTDTEALLEELAALSNEEAEARLRALSEAPGDGHERGR